MPKKRTTQSETVGFTCTPELKEQIERLAAAEHRTVSQWIRLRVEEVLVREEREKYTTQQEAS